jgi:hypothetical protein
MFYEQEDSERGLQSEASDPPRASDRPKILRRERQEKPATENQWRSP